MTKTIIEHNVTTGEVIERPLTSDEIRQLEIDQANAEAKQVEIEAAKAAKQAILDRLGLTEDELRIVLG